MSIKSLVPIQLPADPAAALEAATKQYVDAKAGITNYATRAARASAVPSPVVGQVTTLTDWPGLLHVWDGTGWRVTQSGTNTITTDANSFIVFTWPKPFVDVPTVIAGGYGTTTYSQIVVPLAGGGNLTATGCNFVIRADTGTTFPSTSVVFFWQATGHS